MKTKNRKQTRENIAGQPCPPQTKPVPPAESGTTDRQTSVRPFDPSQLNLLCLANPSDPHSKFNIESYLSKHGCMVPNLSNTLSEWIKKAAALAASEGVSNFELASRGKLPDVVFPPFLKPEKWLAAWYLVPQALADVNAAYPGVIYTEPKFHDAIRCRKVQASCGDTPAIRKAANDWLRTVSAVPPPQRKRPRRSKVKSKEKPGRSAEINLFQMHFWIIPELYMNIVTLRTLYKELRTKQTQRATAHEGAVNELLRRVPKLSHLKERKQEWFNLIVTSPRSIVTACEIVASIPESGLQGHKPESIRKALKRQFRMMKCNPIPKLEKDAREAARKLLEEFNKKPAETSPNVTP